MYRNRLRVFFILGPLVFISSSFLYAQGKIEGSVFDSQNYDPLPGANVFLKGTTYGSVTDLQGKFVISQVPAGNYKLEVRYIGYLEKTVDISVREGQTLKLEAIKLDFKIIEGEAVVVTAQAEGQMAAINQQLTSNTISNVVSQTRIRELPDVNAAESIGRLPGVSISRSGGEATQVQIRGLSAKYNTVTINGVRVPATGGDDRSVDLSLISSNMLDAIEVRKAVTADMDADVLGGTVDLRLKEASERTAISAQAMGGYNRLQDYYGNYNFTSTASHRFFDDRLGVVAGFNADEYDRSADKFQGNYREIQVNEVTDIAVQSILLREENVKRGRAGASLFFDYRISNGKFTANSFYNRLHSEGLYRINRMNVNDNRHYYDLEERNGKTSLFTGDLGVYQDFGWMRYDASVARTASRAENPEDRTWSFAQENAAFSGVTNDTRVNEVPAHATVDSNLTGLQSIYLYNTKRDENQTSVQLNLKLPFHLGRSISGYIKTGGKFRWLDRTNDENQYGRDGLQYGSSASISQPLGAIIRGLSQQYPDEWNWDADSALVRKYGVLPISRVLSNYARSDFFNGNYPLGFVADVATMNKMTEVLRGTSEWLRYAIGSRGRDYDGTEHYYAGYIMSEFSVGRYVTFLPGIRYEKDYSKYHGQRYREVVVNNIQRDPTDLVLLENERENEFWLPMVHLKVEPVDWLKVRLAYTETLTRPDYIQYAPITSINSYSSYIRAANALLKPARSKNYDAAFSVYERHVGLFTASGFYKDIHDLILQSSIFYQSGITLPPGLNIPNSWLQSASPQIDTYTNNPFPATYKGYELDWQTHFWYLPSILRGLVLNVNYTHIFSDIEKEMFFVVDGGIIPGTRPPRRSKTLVDSSRTARMPDQPAHILNTTLGYDYKGFSVRLSYLYQTDKVTFISTEPALDNFSGAYARWDLTLQQKLGGTGIQLFANFTNLNDRSDENFRGYTLTDPAYIEQYGFAMDIGARYRF